ncbi:MAG TPA: hypothetical protein PLU22_12240 [Polyangiaceae bacterium]|nr:hypothetical protein [Polyangiaceae bacterium]
MNAPLPPFDPLGLPLVPWLLHAIAYLTLTLHFAAMQFTVGGALLMLLCWRRQPGIARFFGTALPLGFSYLVTFGIPPLLFVQVIYGQFFYSSSVLIGAYWIAVIPLIIGGYAASYWHRMTRDVRVQNQRVVIATIVACVLLVGYIYVNNLALSLRPDLWLAHYAAYPSGNALVFGEPTLHARYLLFVVPALMTAGMALVLRASFLRGRGATAEADSSYTVGVRSLAVGFLLEVGAAAWFGVAAPPAVREAFAAPGALPWLAAASALLALGALVAAYQSQGRAGLGLPLLGAHLLLGAVACLVVVRDLVRQIYLRPYFEVSSAPVLPQWGMFAAFALVLVTGVAFLVVTTRQTVQGLLAASRRAAAAPAGASARRRTGVSRRGATRSRR